MAKQCGAEDPPSGFTWGSAALRNHFASLMPSLDRLALRIGEGIDATRTHLTKDGPVEVVDYEQRRESAKLAAGYRGIRAISDRDDAKDSKIIVQIIDVSREL